VPRDAPNVELKKGEEVFDEDDARAMSPRRNSEDLEKMSQEARAQLSQSVLALPPYALSHASPTAKFIILPPFPQNQKTHSDPIVPI
jgi:hypothetical protein